jgi:hypothetical protein
MLKPELNSKKSMPVCVGVGSKPELNPKTIFGFWIPSTAQAQLA